ncbi:hypothetical protein phiSTEC1575Stx2k_06 [Escherichia phage phiSTEC1575-Stx2k]|nr:hypothetical protein phiSTEC1575Stx2k_06 [Escherichia phage phiSTEC1575-Stx2k]
MAAGRILNMKNSVMVENIFQRKSLTHGWREIIFNGPSELWMKMILIWTQMVPILPPGNRSARKVKAGSLVPFMTLKMVLFVYG